MDLSQNKINQQSSTTGTWICPCTGCKKARKQAFKEITAIIEGGGDAYSRINDIKKLIEQ